jgi:hypothetical protein
MNPIASFALAEGPWQNFYMLLGTAAATLIGLMVVAVTFGANLVTPETAPTARAFLDPPFTHFTQTLVTAALLLMPSMGPVLLGALLASIGVLRTAALFRIVAHMRLAHERAGDIELSDWITGVVIPALCYLALIATGGAFAAKYEFSFPLLAGVTLVVLLSGIYGAWEMMLWMALARSQKKER